MFYGNVCKCKEKYFRHSQFPFEWKIPTNSKQISEFVEQIPFSLLFTIFMLILGENIRDSLWDTSTENQGENKGHEYWAVSRVPY